MQQLEYTTPWYNHPQKISSDAAVDAAAATELARQGVRPPLNSVTTEACELQYSISLYIHPLGHFSTQTACNG